MESASFGSGSAASDDYNGFTEDQSIYLNLSAVPIRFEPVSKTTNVFYDDANQQVFTVRSGGSTGVVCKGPKTELNCTFRMEDRGPVLSIKFSPDQRILAIQRTQHSVEFINFPSPPTATHESCQPEYFQCCRNKNADILGFLWVHANEILFITKLGLELFQIFPEKRILKYAKGVSTNIDWFLHSPENNVLLISSSNILQPYKLFRGNIQKFSKLDIDQASLTRTSSSRSTSERDVSVVTLYKQTAVLILRHKPKASTSNGAEVDVYILEKDQITSKSYVLKLDTSGHFAINVIDNLIIVHHQASKTSMLFDIRLTGISDGQATYHQPIVVAMPIKPFRLKILANIPEETAVIDCDMYSINWVVFQPNVIIDAKLGCLWFLELTLDPFKDLMPNKVLLVEVFLQRKNGKKYLLELLKDTVFSPELKQYSLVPSVCDRLNENYRSFLNVELHNQMSLPVSGKSEIVTPKGTILVDQNDLYTNIFSNFQNYPNITNQYIIFAVTEFIRSLTQYQIPVQHYLYELVINAIVKDKAFFQLHQFLMCHVVTDSKPLACLLLSLEGIYPPAHQLALDMLKRLGTANDLIVEILLNKSSVIAALRFQQSVGRDESIQARKYLDAAKKSNDDSVFYSVYKFFQDRNIRHRHVPTFEPSEMCDIYVEHFNSLHAKYSQQQQIIRNTPSKYAAAVTSATTAAAAEEESSRIAVENVDNGVSTASGPVM